MASAPQARMLLIRFIGGSVCVMGSDQSRFGHELRLSKPSVSWHNCKVNPFHANLTLQK
jgi:hypothetical protein